MNDGEINIAIAEARGWRNVRELDDIYPDGSVAAGIWWQGLDPTDSQERVIPDYCNDLNAMHEAIMAQPQEMRARINHTLAESMRSEEPWLLDRIINAAARQRAEAFLRTIGKWVE